MLWLEVLEPGFESRAEGEDLYAMTNCFIL